jgi:L-malate glycosyltransferase
MIVFVHLLNDRSGSPAVLASAIRALGADGAVARLFVGSDGDGRLNDVPVSTTRYWYRRGSHRLITLATYFISQVFLFLRLLLDKDIPRDAVLYVNTLLPFGAAIFGRLTGRRVVYHLHEVSVSPAALRWFLTFVARHTARRLIYVSDFHRSRLPISPVPSVTVYNSLEASFAARAKGTPYRHRHDGVFRVLMLASLRDYKGIPEFVALANRLCSASDICFDLVANDENTAVRQYFSRFELPPNFTVHSSTGDTAQHYAHASLVVNLSRPDLWIETFGLTLLEAMAFGVPVIAPPVGGPVELVVDGKEGFLVDCRQSDQLTQKVLLLASSQELSLSMSAAARDRAATFSETEFVRGLRRALAIE